MSIHRIFEMMIPAVFFFYLIGVTAVGGVTLLASTLPVFTMFYAFFGMIVFSRGRLRQNAEHDSAQGRK